MKEAVEDFVCALLSVNSWTLEQTFAIRENLAREGLLDVESIRSMTVPKIFLALNRAGYKRGDYITGLLAERLASLAESLSSPVALDRLGEDAFLLSIKGVGPAVLRNFKALRGSKAREK